jgi:hypothetical protein
MNERYTDQEMIERYASADTRATDNNVLRHEYRTLTDDEKRSVTEMKDLGARFLQLCDECGQGREFSLAKTNMEQAVMWGVKGITA